MDRRYGEIIEGLLLGYALLTVLMPHINPGFQAIARAFSYGFLGIVFLYIGLKILGILIEVVKLIWVEIVNRYVGVKAWIQNRYSKQESEPDSSLPDTLE